MAADKQKYNRNLTTTHGDKVTTTEHGDKTVTTTHEPKITTRTEQSVNGFYNPDGTPNAAAQQYFDDQRQAYAAAYGIDPNTGRVQRRFVSDILGVDPEVMRKKRQQEQELNRAKQKESALYNSLAVLGDMITTAGGGNVWQRNADQHAKQAHADNLALQKEQQAEDIANNDKLRSTEQAYAAAVQKLRDSVGTAFGTKVTNTMEQGGKSTATTTQGKDTSTTTQGNDRTTGYIEGRTAKGSGSGSGSNATSYLPIKVHTAKGEETYRLAIPKAKKDAIANELANVLALQPDYQETYQQYITTTGYGTKETQTIDLDRLINDGVYMNNPNIMNTFIDELQRGAGITDAQGKPAGRAQIYEMITGEKITDNNGNIIPDKVLKGVRINGVDGTKATNNTFGVVSQQYDDW